jgi:hypothetical protein
VHETVTPNNKTQKPPFLHGSLTVAGHGATEGAVVWLATIETHINRLIKFKIIFIKIFLIVLLLIEFWHKK